MTRRKHNRPAAFAADPARRNLPAEARGLIATAHNDITIPWFSGAMIHADDTLIAQGGGKGLAIYDEIERDTHAGAMLAKRRIALIQRAWEVQPGGDRPADKEAADLVERQLRALPFDRICGELLDATLKGFAVGEVVWDRDGPEIVARQVVVHDPRRFAFGPDWQPRLLTRESARDGLALPERKFMVHRHGAKGNNPYGLGLGSSLFWPVLFKREGIAFWLHFLEKFAGPTVVGKIPYGMPSEDQVRLLNNLASTRTSSAILVPIGTEVEFLEASRSGSVTYEQFLAYWDKQISLRVTGETLTSQVTEGGGNRALGEVHQEMLDQLVDSDADLLTDTLRDQLCRWIVDYNLPGAAVPSVWRLRPKNEVSDAAVREKKAIAAERHDMALRAIVAAAAGFEDDAVARDYIVSFDITDRMSERTIDALVAGRAAFGKDGAGPDPFLTADPADPGFAAGRLKKKLRLTGTSALPEPTGR